MTTSRIDDYFSCSVDVPPAYALGVPWVSQIGDAVPDFRMPFTLGPIRFHDWARGAWVLLFGHHGAFSPVSTS